MRPTLMVSSATALTQANAMNVAAINLHHIALSLLAYSRYGHPFDARHHLCAPIGGGATEIRLKPTVQRKPCLLRCMSPLRHSADKLPRPPFVRGKAGLAANVDAASAVDC